MLLDHRFNNAMRVRRHKAKQTASKQEAPRGDQPHGASTSKNPI
jgi:hypothetical protein